MDKLSEENYKGFIILIYKDGEGKYSFEMLDLNRKYLCNISLWNLKIKFVYDETGELIHKQHDLFGANDYYQDDMGASKPKQGYCSALHEYIITHSKTLPFPIDNIYSSSTILKPGIKFWESQVKKGKAEYVANIERYKLKI